jgi:putative peptidoglycan lipid II flippase
VSGRLASVAVSLAGLTLASRVLGFGRSVVFSKTVGATCLGDAYNAANALPNVLFEITAGGVLAGVVIPVVARHVGAGRQSQASETTSALMTWTVLVLTVPGVLALLGAGLYAQAFASPVCADSGTAIAAFLVMFVPQIWLYGLAVVSAGVLQAHDRFFAAALAPLLSSVVVIGAYLLFAALAVGAGVAASEGASFAPGLRALGWGTTAGVLVLALATLLPLRSLGLRLRPRLRFASGDRTVIAGMAAAGAAGVIVQQLSVLVINHSAQGSGSDGALTRFTWANAIYLLPYAVLAAPLLQLAFPRLSAAAEQGVDDLRRVVSEVTPPIVLLACLGAALLAGTAVPMARVFVLGPGNGATGQLAGPIAAFAPAVVGFALLGLATRTLLAEHRSREAGITTVVGWTAVIVGALLRRDVTWLAGSVSVGLAIGAAAGWVLVGRVSGTSLRGPLVRPLLVGLLAAAVAVAAAWWPARLAADAGLLVAVAVGVGVAALGAMIFLVVVRIVRPALFASLLALRHRTEGTRA